MLRLRAASRILTSSRHWTHKGWLRCPGFGQFSARQNSRVMKNFSLHASTGLGPAATTGADAGRASSRLGATAATGARGASITATEAAGFGLAATSARRAALALAAALACAAEAA